MAYLYPWGNTQQLNLDWILQKIKDIEAGAGGADLDEISNALLAASYAARAYEQFDIVFYDGKLYLANVDIPAPGEAWTPAHWDEIILGGPVSALLKHVTNLSADNVINDSQVTGDTVSDALNTLKNAIDGITLDSDSVSNESQVTGANVSDALDNLNGAISTIEDGMAIVSNNNTHAAIASGQYVYIKNHGTLAEGIYKATSNIPLNGTLSATNVTLIVGGAFNQITPIELGGTGESTILAAAAAFRQALTVTVTIPANSSVQLSLTGVTTLFYAYIGSSPTTCSVIIITGYSGHTNLLTVYPAQTEGNIRFTQGSTYVTITNADANNARNVTFNVLSGLPSNVVIS